MKKKILFLILVFTSQNIFSQDEKTDSEKTIPKDNQTQSAPATVRLNTPTLNMDVLLDLYNKDIDFIVDYTGKSFTKPKGVNKGKIPTGVDEDGDGIIDEKPKRSSVDEIEDPKKIREEDLAGEISDIIDTAKINRKGLRTGSSYSKEDADYNKALYNLQNSQNLFSRRKYMEALTEIDKSIIAAPNLALAHSVRGSILFMLKRKDEAKTSWERALELDPSMDNVRAILYRMN